ncbi:MAG: hypothetical protein FGM57_02625 [Candidatus Taylorbacteria bacterium]|nr:hypothetical protein [Candidatus Taylorbacteria bacterium]
MINKKFQNLIEDLQSVKMTRDEKADLKARVLMSINAAESVLESDSQAPVSVKSVYHGAQEIQKVVARNWYSYFAEKKFVPAFAVLLVLVSTGGISIAAEKALPGDMLYSLKVNVNEEVRGLVAVTPEAKAKFALEVTDRRLKEAALLSTSGRLDAKATGIIQKQITRQASQVKNQVASLVSTNNLKSAQEIALNFESALRTHEFILQKLSADDKSTTTPSVSENNISAIIATVQTELATTTSSRTQIQTQEIAKSYSKNLEEITNRLVELRLKIREVGVTASSATLTPAASSTVVLYLTQAGDLAVVAKAKIDLDQFADALTAIQKASQYVSDTEAIIAAISNDPKNNADITTVIQSALSSSTTLPISAVDTASDVASSTAPTATSTPATENSTSTPNQVQ